MVILWVESRGWALDIRRRSVDLVLHRFLSTLAIVVSNIILLAVFSLPWPLG